MSLDDLDQSGIASPTPSTSIATFTPKNHATAAANLAEYIRSAKEDLTVLGSDLDWSAWKWPGVGSFIKHDWIKSSKRKNIPFSHLLHPSFIEFAKAYIRERHAQNPRESSSHHHHRLPPLRLLEMALLEFHSDANPANINIAVLDRAAALIPKYFSGQNVYQTGQSLQTDFNVQQVTEALAIWPAIVLKLVLFGHYAYLSDIITIYHISYIS